MGYYGGLVMTVKEALQLYIKDMSSDDTLQAIYDTTHVMMAISAVNLVNNKAVIELLKTILQLFYHKDIIEAVWE